MNRKSTKDRAQILRCLVEGNSIRSTSRITGASKNTVTKLLVEVGKACSDYQNEHLTNLNCKRIQCDEIWSFVYSKKKNVPERKKGQFGYGDIYTWTALDPDSKLMVSYMVGERTEEYASAFIADLAPRLNSKVQMTTDGLKLYLEAVEESFGADVDYAMLIKVYGNASKEGQKRYGPAEFTGTEKKAITGDPIKEDICTSHVERQNLTMRMGMRSFTRLTNAFSKKVENHEHAVSLHFMYYNFCRIHKTIKTTPAMEAGVTDRLWDLEDIAGLVD